MGPLILAPLGKSLVCRLLKHLRLDQIFDQQNLYLISWSLPSGALTAWSFLSQRSNVALHWHLDPLMFAVWRLLWSLEKAWFNFDSGHKHFYMRHTLYKWLPLAEGLSVPLMGPLLPTSCCQSPFVDDLGGVRLSTLSVHTSLHNTKGTSVHRVETWDHQLNRIKKLQDFTLEVWSKSLDVELDRSMRVFFFLNLAQLPLSSIPSLSSSNFSTTVAWRVSGRTYAPAT